MAERRAGRIRAAGVLVVVLSALVGAASGGTMAAFSNVTTNAANSFQSATLDPASDLSVSEICGGGGIAFRGATSNGTDTTSLNIGKPTAVVEGDLMLAVVVSRFSDSNPSAPSGWTVLRNDASGLRQKIWYKIAGASEPSSYTFSGTGRAAGGILAYSGVDTTNPFDAHDAQTGSGSTITAPSITTTVANATLVGFLTIRHRLAFTGPSSMTQRVNQLSAGGGGDAHHVRAWVGDEAFAGPGATGTRQATSAQAEPNVGALLALRPVPTQWDASLSWTETPTTWAEGYKVQRWVGETMENEQTVTPRTTTTATDGPLAADTTYEFRVLAFYGTWRSTAATTTFITGSSCGAGSGGGGEGGTYDDEVMADSPFAYWRLGDAILRDDFETFSGWNTEGSGTFEASTEQARSGTGSGKKATNSDPHGGWKGLGATLGNDWTLETWLYRPSVYSGGAADRIGLEDGSGNGYSFAVIHDTNTIRIDRRTGTTGTSINSATVDPPEDAWFRAVLDRSGSSMTFTIYDEAGTQLGQVSASDSTYSSFSRVVVRGGHHYYVDDLSVYGQASGITAVDETGIHDGTYQGGPRLGRPGALAGDEDTSASFDGNDDYVIRNPFNGMPSTAISVEFWMRTTDTSKSGTPVSYATSSNDNAFLIFNYRNFAIYTGGSNVSTGVSANDGAWHHIVVTWRSSDGQTRLYKDGAEAWSGTLSAGTSIPNGGSLVLAQEQDSVGGGFDVNQAFLGDLDEVAIYDKVLSAARIQAHYEAAAGDGSPPAGPTGLTATAVSSSGIDLSWTDNSSDEDGFEVERSSAGAETWTQIDTVAANVTTYEDTGLSGSTAYDYRVRAFNAVGTSAYSNVASATTAPTDIAFVKNVGASACGGTSTTITIPAGGVATGNTLILRAHVHNTTTGTISASDSRGNSYTLDANGLLDGKGRMAILSAHVDTALQSGDTITVTHPDSKSEGVVVDEFSGIAATNRVDATGTGGDKSTSPSATVTTTTSKTLLYGGLWTRSNPALTQASGWTSLTTLATEPSGCETARNRGAYRIVSSTGTYTWNPTLGTNEEWAAALVAYRPA